MAPEIQDIILQFNNWTEEKKKNFFLHLDKNYLLDPDFVEFLESVGKNEEESIAVKYFSKKFAKIGRKLQTEEVETQNLGTQEKVSLPNISPQIQPKSLSQPELLREKKLWELQLEEIILEAKALGITLDFSPEHLSEESVIELRISALFSDTLISFLPFLFSFYFFPGDEGLAFSLVFFIILNLHLLFKDIPVRSNGKRFYGLKLVNIINNSSPSLKQRIIRNIFLVFPLILIEIPYSLLTGRRIGDIVAATRVIKTGEISFWKKYLGKSIAYCMLFFSFIIINLFFLSLIICPLTEALVPHDDLVSSIFDTKKPKKTLPAKKEQSTPKPQYPKVIYSESNSYTYKKKITYKGLSFYLLSFKEKGGKLVKNKGSLVYAINYPNSQKPLFKFQFTYEKAPFKDMERYMKDKNFDDMFLEAMKEKLKKAMESYQIYGKYKKEVFFNKHKLKLYKVTMEVDTLNGTLTADSYFFLTTSHVFAFNFLYLKEDKIWRKTAQDIVATIKYQK